MTKKAMLPLVAALACLTISGCSTPVYEGRYAWSEGWRVGRVTKLVPADEFFRMSGTRCRQTELRPTDQVAVIRWRQVTRAREHFAKVDPDSGTAIGDVVYFNARECRLLHKAIPVPEFEKGQESNMPSNILNK